MTIFQALMAIGKNNSLVNYSYIQQQRIIRANEHNELASNYIKSGEYQKASTHYKISLNTTIQELGENHLLVAKIYAKLGFSCAKLENYEEAITYFQKASSINKTLHGIKHISVALNNNNIAESYKALGDYDKALEYYDLALLSKGDLFDKNYKLMAIIYDNIAATNENLGSHKEAFESYLKACLIRRKYFGEDNFSTAESLLHLKEAIKEIYKYSEDTSEYIKESISILIHTENLRSSDLSFLMKYNILSEEDTPIATMLMSDNPQNASYIEGPVDINSFPVAEVRSFPIATTINEVQIYLVGEDSA
ncbi:MAG: tetratricopeptide repeat protein [Rickettsiaceae bacterium]|nr:tetratricopeptide repeat protein [Rickettsiaceae bacterium]